MTKRGHQSYRMQVSLCVVCRRPTGRPVPLCPSCCRSYDRAAAKDSTTMALLTWAAQRAWKFARDDGGELSDSEKRLLR